MRLFLRMRSKWYPISVLSSVLPCSRLRYMKSESKHVHYLRNSTFSCIVPYHGLGDNHSLYRRIQYIAISGSLLPYVYRICKKPLEPSTVIRHATFERHYSKNSKVFEDGLEDIVAYENVVSETLESLCETFENLIEDDQVLAEGDASLSSGVLTVNLGKRFGTYVINQQTPNRQIWLSSPFSGPKRYDFLNGHWIYKRDDTSLHELLSKEMTSILKKEVDFSSCAYGKSS